MRKNQYIVGWRTRKCVFPLSLGVKLVETVKENIGFLMENLEFSYKLVPNRVETFTNHVDVL